MSELGDLLELLYGARGSWRSVRLTVRDWTHNDRARVAFERRVERLEGRGRRSLQVSYYAPGSSEPPPETSEHETRTWIDGDRSRVESDRPEGPTAVVHDGGNWWMTSPRRNLTNSGDPHHHAGGGDVEQMLDPSGLSAVFELEPLGPREVAGRPGIAVRAIPRAGEHHSPFFWQATGADEIEYVVDAERGVLLRTEARLGGEPYNVREIVAIAFDESFPDEIFRIELPPGESFEEVGGQPPKPLTLDEAVRRASFPLFVPARPGPGWRLQGIGHSRALEGPLRQESVHLTYRHEGGAHEFQLVESTEPHPWLGSDELTTVERDGLVLKVLDPDEDDFPMPRHVLVERDGTHVNLMSQELPVEELVEIAISLVPASDSPPPAVST